MNPFGYALRHGDHPGWYDLLATRYGLTVIMPSPIFHVIQQRMQTGRVVRIDDRLTLPAFTPPLTQRWGFGGNAEFVRHRDFTILRFPFPKHVGHPAAEHDFAAMHATLAAFTATTNALMVVDDTEAWTDRQQVLAVTGVLIAPLGTGNAAVEAWISGMATRWLAAQPEMSNQPLVSEAMRLVHQRLTGQTIRPIDAPQSFRCALDPVGRMILTCPGQACGLSPENTSFDQINGGRLTSNNVDNPRQALTLLAGLAAFNMAVRMTAAVA